MGESYAVWPIGEVVGDTTYETKLSNKHESYNPCIDPLDDQFGWLYRWR